MRALLVLNPAATTTTAGVVDVIAATLGRELKLDVEATKRRDHAGFIAAGAAHEGYEVVFALGGDGTVNEVLQGIAGTPVRLGILPGGSTNVWARTFDLANDPVEAATMLLRCLEDRSERTVNLGVANNRFFGFNAGFGFDAEVVRFVERRYRLKRTVRQMSFLYCGLLAYLAGFDRRSEVTVTVDGAPVPDVLRTVVCCNSNPYTYLGPWPVQLCPDADLHGGLDLLGVTDLSVGRLLRLARRAMSQRVTRALRFARTWHDRPVYELTSPIPLPLQVDGDFVGETDRVSLRVAERAVTVVAPPVR